MKVEIVYCPTWGNNQSKVASLASLIKERLGIEATRTPGGKGQFDVIADGETIARRGGNFLTRQFGAGYPDLETVVAALEARKG